MRQSGSTSVVKFSPDGKYVAVLKSASHGAVHQGVWIWDTETGLSAGPSELEQSDASDLAWSPDGSQFAIARPNKELNWGVEVWNLSSQKRIRTFSLIESDLVRSISWSADGRKIAAGQLKSHTTVWDSQTGEQVMRLAFPSDVVALTPDGSQLVVGDLRRIRLLSIPDQKTVHELSEGINWLGDIEVSPQGDLIAVGTVNHLLLWDRTTGEVTEVPGRKDIGDVSFDRSGKLLAFQDLFEEPKVLNIKTGEVTSMRVQADWACDISADGKLVATADARARLNVVATGEPDDRFPGHSTGIKSIQATTDGRYAVTLGFAEDVRLWDLATRKHVRRLNIDEDVFEFKLLKHQELLAVRTRTKQGIRFFQFPSFELEKTALTIVDATTDIRQFGGSVILDGGRALAFTDERGDIHVVQTTDSSESIVIPTDIENMRFKDGRTDPVILHVAPDNRTIARCFWNLDTIEIVDLVEKSVRCTVQDGIQKFLHFPVTFTSDSSKFLTVGERGVLEFDATSGKLLRVFETSAQISVITLSDDELYLAIAEMGEERNPVTQDFDQSIRIFDYKSGESLAVLDTSGSWISALAFTSDGTKLLSGAQDSTLLVWDLLAAVAAGEN